jgi:uncharacterized protein (DUF2062 family)
MGIVPIWGFQMLVAITLSVLFRLNKALVIIAANISIPPMIPVVIYLSHLTGKIWMGKEAQTISFSDEITLDLIHNNFMQYVYGAITLALVAGISFGTLTYGLLKLSKRKTKIPQAES